MIKQATPDLQKFIHDLRQPIATMRSFVRLLPQNVHDPEFLRDYQTHVQSALEKMEQLLLEIEPASSINE